MKNIVQYEPRAYQSRIRMGRLAGFRVRVKETDLHIQAKESLADEARESILRHRGYLEAFISAHPAFAATLKPWVTEEPLPGVIRDMVCAGVGAGVGPMAAVAGAIAQRVAGDLSNFSEELIVENGGDICIRSKESVTVALFAGRSPFSMKMGIAIEPTGGFVGVCTSSGTVGHSLSFGKADAVSIVSDDCALADAVATALGNRVRNPKDIDAVLEFGGKIPGVKAIAIVMGKAAGFWGEIRLVPVR